MRVHYINVEDAFDIAYFPDSKRFFKVNTTGKMLINDMCKSMKKNDLFNKYNINEKDYNFYISSFSNKINCDINKNFKINNKSNLKVLSRLVIHLTNDCNLRCVYCYANGGTYLSDIGRLSAKTLNQILEVFYNEFDIINVVQFFGGEPLLNVPILEMACEKIRNIDLERKYETKFGLVTNGTILNDKIINLINKYKIMVTVSYDGHPMINNITRIDRDGKGTSNKILKNVKKMKKETGEPNTIEVTYNQHHIKNNISILDVIKHIHNVIPDTYIHLVPAGGSEDSNFVINNLNVFADSVYDIFEDADNLKEGESVKSYSLADRIFYAIKNQDSIGSPYICDAGIGQFLNIFASISMLILPQYILDSIFKYNKLSAAIKYVTFLLAISLFTSVLINIFSGIILKEKMKVYKYFQIYLSKNR